MNELPSSNRPLVSQADLNTAERAAIRHALAIGFAGALVFVVGVSALVAFSPNGPSNVAFLGP